MHQAESDGENGDVADPRLIGLTGLMASGEQRTDRFDMLSVDASGEAPRAPRHAIVPLHQPPALLAVHAPAAVAPPGAISAAAAGAAW